MKSPAFLIDLRLHLSLLSSVSSRRSSDSLATSTLLLLLDLTIRKDLAETLQTAVRLLALRLRQQLRTLMSRKVSKKLQAELLCNAREPFAFH
jgi:hypothetical protein